MRISCPYCGARDVREFTYLGDATVKRPSLEEGADPAYAYVYERTNPAGLHRELWHHGMGCRAWLVVTRDTRNHAIADVEPAPGADSGGAP